MHADVIPGCANVFDTDSQAYAELANVFSLSGLEDKSQKSKAERIAFDLLEYLDQINYNKYYESMGSPGTRGGEKEKLFSDFSTQSIKAAQVTYCSLQTCAAELRMMAAADNKHTFAQQDVDRCLIICYIC